MVTPQGHVFPQAVPATAGGGFPSRSALLNLQTKQSSNSVNSESNPGGDSSKTIKEQAEVDAAKTGASSLYDDVTRAGSRYANRATDVTKANFEKNLIDSGWARSVSQDGKTIILQRDGAKYVLRDGAKSTGGPTADFYKADSKGIDVKIRLEQGGIP